MTSFKTYDPKYLGEANYLARQLSSMEKRDDIEEFGPEILRLMSGAHIEVFKMLNEKPDRWNYMNDRFYMLRRVRNDKEWGNRRQG